MCWFCGKRGGGGGREGLLPAWETAVSQSINQDEENFFKGKRGEREKQKSVGRWKKKLYLLLHSTKWEWLGGRVDMRKRWISTVLCGHEGTEKVRVSQISHKNKKAINVFALPPFHSPVFVSFKLFVKEKLVGCPFRWTLKTFLKGRQEGPLDKQLFFRRRGKAKRN